MKKYLVVFLAFIPFIQYAQNWSVEKGVVTFFSDAAIEDIKATNKKPRGLWAKETNAIAFEVPIIDFKFAKNLMQQHFNEKYMETEKFPKASFEGVVNNFKPDTKGVQNVSSKGKMTIHGVTREIDIPGTAEVTADKKIVVKSKFMVKLEDYKIAIPQLMWQNIAEQVEVTVEFTFK
jgi:hypothetical protein